MGGQELAAIALAKSLHLCMHVRTCSGDVQLTCTRHYQPPSLILVHSTWTSSILKFSDGFDNQWAMAGCKDQGGSIGVY